MKRGLSLVSALLLVAASALPVLDSYVPPAGWTLSEDRRTGPGTERIWRRGDDYIRRYIVIAQFHSHSSEEIRRSFMPPAVPGVDEPAIESIVSEQPCGNAKESWRVVMREPGVKPSEKLTILQFTPDYAVFLNYSHPLGESPDKAAVQSLETYCAPGDTQSGSPPAPVAQAQPQASVHENAATVRLFGFSYTPPFGWHSSSLVPKQSLPVAGHTDLLLWDRRNEAIVLGVMERSPGPVGPLDAQRIKNGYERFAQDVSVATSAGCNGRTIVIAEYKVFHRTWDRPFENQPEYVTVAWINGETNYATVSYRRGSPARDEEFMQSINGLCFWPGVSLGQLPVERFALPVVEKRL